MKIQDTRYKRRFDYWLLVIGICLVIVSWLLVICPAAFAEVDILGYYENNLVGMSTRTGEAIAADLNRLRLRLDVGLLPSLNLHLEPEYNYLSAGLLSKVLAIKESIAKGRKKFDFLKGEEIYKHHLGGKEIPLFRCQISI